MFLLSINELPLSLNEETMIRVAAEALVKHEWELESIVGCLTDTARGRLKEHKACR